MIFTNGWGIFAWCVVFLQAMKNLFLLLVAVWVGLGSAVSSGGSGGEPSLSTFPDAEPEGLTLMFWNLENFFDYIDGGAGESDTEFSSRGERHWTKKRFYAKCNAFAKAVLWIGSTRDLPDVIAVAEVENRFVLRQLVNATALRKLDYAVLHYDSPDPRGIDCALLYRTSRLRLLGSKPCPVGQDSSLIASPDSSSLASSQAFFQASSLGSSPDSSHASSQAFSPDSSLSFSRPSSQVQRDTFRTRDILLAQFITPAGDSLAIFVNHHPSKYGGSGTDWRREIAVERLRALSDSIAAEGWRHRIALGDFNDTPDNPLFDRLAPSLTLCPYGPSPSSASAGLSALFSPASAGHSGPASAASRSLAGRASASLSAPPRGSIRFNGEWQLIDLCFASPSLLPSSATSSASSPSVSSALSPASPLTSDAVSSMPTLSHAPECRFVAVPIPFLTTRDAAHSGDKPLRTYSGPRYLGGVSDHLPILVTLRFP